MPQRNLPILSRLAILSSGFDAQFGWIFFGFGMIFFWIFFMNSEIIDLFAYGDWDPTTGTVVKLDDTDAEVNNTDVYEYTYEYNVNGEVYTGTAYTTGRSFREGQNVSIEYNPDQPGESRMADSRSSLFGWETIFVIIFPLVGLGFILHSFRQNMKSIDLLVNGRFARGKLINKEPTNVKINDRTVYKYTFSFEAHDGRTYEATGKTHIQSLLEDEETERLIYAPNDPSYATMYDTIPSAPKINPDGSFRPLRITSYLNLILPLVSIIIHGGFYLIRYVL
ncbi:MAG: DUF3592 domain-containing protein [Bacteroidia bacterium]